MIWLILLVLVCCAIAYRMLLWIAPHPDTVKEKWDAAQRRDRTMTTDLQTKEAMTSTDVAVTAPEMLVDVRSGEVLPATPENAVELLLAARDIRRNILDLVKACEFVLREESQRQGTKTLKLPGGTATITGGSELAWDLEELAKLLAVGLPDERYGELVVTTVTYKVDARVAKQLEAANPAYAEIIANARTTVEKPWRVSVK